MPPSPRAPVENSSHSRDNTGICSVCGATFKVLSTTGVLRKHGHGHGNLIVTVLDDSLLVL